MHGWAIAGRIRRLSQDVLLVQQGSLYPALQRLEHQRLDQREVGNLGSKTAREVLPADPGGTPAARQRDGAVGATGGRGDAGRAHELAMRILSILWKRARALCRGGAMD